MNPKRTRPLRGFLRPLLLLLTLSLCLSGLFVAQAAGDDGVVFLLFHDQNGNGRWDAGEPVPGTAATLGISGVNVPYSGILSTLPDNLGGTQANYLYLDSLPDGTYRFWLDTAPGGFRPNGKGQYLLEEKTTGTSYISTGTFTVAAGQQISISVPLLADPADTASVTGRVTFADSPTTGVAGARVDLIDETATYLLETTSTDAYGAYRFSSLPLGYYRVQVTPPEAPQGIRYQLETPRSDPFLVADASQTEGPGFEVSRVTSVRFWLGGALVGEYVNAPFGQTVPQPEISSSFLQLSNGYRTITGWYQDAARTVPWDFSGSTVSGATDLYAAYTTTYYTTSSDRSRGGSTRRDSDPRPTIKNASAVISGNNVILTVEMDGIFDVFDYQWQLLDDDQAWMNLSGATQAVSTLNGVEPGRTYTFRVQVWRTYDGVQIESGNITVRAPGGTAEEVAGDPEDPEDYIPPLNNWDGSAAAFTLSADVVFEGGRTEALASATGGQWVWDSNYLTVEQADSATPVFTAVQPGTTTITYRNGAASASVSVLIHPSTLPATGQSLTPVFLLAGSGLLLLAAAAVLMQTRKRRGRHAGQ